ncbi:sodium pump decarboxylase gamma subunit [Acutalibacter sp. 1XD8-33]|nr:sodium pump decarboxylase gamma subunit [Acutalibacter sp. 1XD8-33]
MDPDIVEALGIMGKGMLGIFVVIGLIAIIVSLLTKLGSQK